MAPAVEPVCFCLCVLQLLLLLLWFQFPLMVASKWIDEPTPAAWPHQFHSVLFMNNSGTLQKVDLWYDWPNGRNFNIIQNQLGKLTYDLEWDNGTSYIYTVDMDVDEDPSNHECKTLHFSVGILRPNWLDGASYLGQHHVDNFLCNVWQKVDFILYYEDVLTQRPVKWIFYTGYTAHVITFEVGAELEDAKWQAPVYCFNEVERNWNSTLLQAAGHGGFHGRFIREISIAANAV